MLTILVYGYILNFLGEPSRTAPSFALSMVIDDQRLRFTESPSLAIFEAL